MIADGVDVRSEEDVQRWIDDFNRRPAADRAAVVVGEELAAALAADDDADETDPLPPIRPASPGDRARHARRVVPFRRAFSAGEAASAAAAGGDAASGAESDAFELHVRAHRGTGVAMLDGTLQDDLLDDDGLCVALWAEALDCLLSCPESEGPGEWGEHIGVVLPGVLTLLYAAREPLPWDLVLHAAREQYLVVGDPFFGVDGEEETDPDDVGGAAFAEALRFRVRRLVAWGVIEEAAGGLGLTRLAEAAWMAEMREAGLIAPAIGDLAESPAAELLEDAAGYPEDMFVEEVEGWLARRDPERAALEVLQAGADGDPATRQVAYGVLSMLGPEATAGVFTGLELPAVRPYVFVWCGEKGIDVDAVPTADELGWLLIDSGAAAVQAGEPEQAAQQLDGIYDQDQAGYLEGLWRLEHPNTPEVLEAIGAHHPIPQVAKAARKAALRSRSLRAGRQS